jgi:hypothetical protein
MTPEQSRQLKIGNRVCFNGDPEDSGKVMAVRSRYVTIRWDDGHESFTGHAHMERVELVKKCPAINRVSCEQVTAFVGEQRLQTLARLSRRLGLK